MKKKNKGQSWETLVSALEKLPNPIWDKKHNLQIYFENDRTRSNENRFEHISGSRHELKVRDIESIPKGIQDAIIRKDNSRKRAWSLYFQRKGKAFGYVKIGLKVDPDKPEIAKVKTIFITKKIK